jgi:hypothetical protein
MLARRSSIRSRSTSQYLSAESRSLSGGSACRDSSRSVAFVCPKSFAALSSLRLDLALPHLPRLGRPPPVTIVSSFVLSACNSHHNSGAAVKKPFPLPSPYFNSNRAAKVSRGGPRRYCCGRGTGCFGLRVVGTNRQQQMHFERTGEA